MSATAILTPDRLSLEDSSVVLPEQVRERLLDTIRRRLPTKSFGYLLSRADPRRVDDFLLLEANTRNSPDWKGKFEAYGQYFLDHDDAGFVCTPEESWRMQKQVWASGMTEVGVFHSHLRHPANFSLIDYDLHTQRYSHIWHLIVSMRNPDQPQLRVFDVAEGEVREQPVIAEADPCAETPAVSTRAQAAEMLRRDNAGLPRCRDSRTILAAIEWLQRHHEQGLIDAFLTGSGERFATHIAPTLKTIPGGCFFMGTDTPRRRHFVGESPRIPVSIPSFRVAPTQVTNGLFSLLYPERPSLSAGAANLPAVDLSWYDATFFALWMGCRLPTEAEWEFACGAGMDPEWACGDETMLPRMAWYSENSGGRIHPVAALQPNLFGLHDLHGNVWEWCSDSWYQDRYSKAANSIESASAAIHRVCRGGSVHALSEMCRTRYRFHDPAGCFASDLGFRLAADIPQDE